MRFKIGDNPTVYDAASVSDLTLRMALQLERETAAEGRRLTLGEVQEIVETLDGLKTDAERMRHPDGAWALAVMIWTARRLAGETVTFGEAIDFPLSGLKFLPEPQDHKAAKAAPRKARPRKAASGRAANQGADAAQPTPTAFENPSTSD